MLIGGISVLSAVAALVLCGCFGGYESLVWLWQLPVLFVGGFLALALVFFLVLLVSCALVDTNKEQKEDSPYYRFLIRLIAEAAIPILQVRMTTSGLEQIPKQGRFLLVCNHLDYMDPVILLHYFRDKQLAFISKRENSSMFLVGKLLHKVLCQLINRENDREALKTIVKCIQLIKEDKASVAVFPEGYINQDRKFHEFRHGVFKIAQKTGVPIVICTVTNTHKVFKNAAKLKPTDVSLHVVKVLYPEDFAGSTTVELGQRIHALMAADLGPDYVPEENT